MEEVLEPFREFVGGLIDDISVWADDLETLHKRLKKIIARLNEYELLLSMKKSRFFMRSGVFLGFMVSSQGIEADPRKVAVVRDRPLSNTTTDIRAFVHAAGYLQTLIPHFAELSAPLTALGVGSKNTPVQVTPEAVIAFNAIREALTTTPVVKSFDWKLPVVIETDASATCLGAAPFQPHLRINNRGKQRSFLHPCGYFSKKLTTHTTTVFRSRA